MPSNINPASIKVGKGLAPNGTVSGVSLTEPNRDVQSLGAHIGDPVRSHMASAIGIVDAGGFFTSDEVEGALQELGGGGSFGRQNGLVIGGTFTSGAGVLTLDTPTKAVLNGSIVDFGGATVTLTPSTTSYVYVDASTAVLTSSLILPPVADEPVLIAKVVTDAGNNIVSSQDARFFVTNLDRKIDYSLRSDGSSLNDASEACFVTMEAAIFWLQNYVSTGQERKAVVIVRGGHTISSTVTVPSGIPNVEFRGEGAASFSTGAALSPMFDVSGASGVTFTGVTFVCDHALSTAISTDNAALPCSNVTVQNCRFISGGSTWNVGVRLYQATPNIQQGHRIFNCDVTASSIAIKIDRAVDCVVRDCTLTGDNTVTSVGISITRIVPTGDNCLLENVRVTGGFDYPISTSTSRTSIKNCYTSGGMTIISGSGVVVDGCSFVDTADTTAGLNISSSAVGAVVTNTTVSTTTAWAPADDPSGILVNAQGVRISDCRISGFNNFVGGLGSGVKVGNASHVKITSSSIEDCYNGVSLANADNFLVMGCRITDFTNGVKSDSASSSTYVTDCHMVASVTRGERGVSFSGTDGKVTGCQISTLRPNNTYGVIIPAGVELNGSGPYTISNCTFTGFYSFPPQQGGGIYATTVGVLSNVTVEGNSFLECGIFATLGSISYLSVIGCKFLTSVNFVENAGIKVTATGTVSDVTVSGCHFAFNTTDTRSAVWIDSQTTQSITVSDSTFFMAPLGAASRRFLNLSASASGDGLVVTGNTVTYTNNNTGPIVALNFKNTEISNNIFRSLSPNTDSYVAYLNYGNFLFNGNIVEGMGGINLSHTNGSLPSGIMSSNTFNGSNNGGRGIDVTDFNTPMSIKDLVVSGNDFRDLLEVVRLENGLNSLSVSGFSFTDNRVNDCTVGVVTDADSLESVSVSNNSMYVQSYAMVSQNTSSSASLIRVCNNLVYQSNFSPIFPSSAIIQFKGSSADRIDINNNNIQHSGDVGAIHVTVTQGLFSVNVNDNSVENEINSSDRDVYVSVTGAAYSLADISLSRNMVSHMGNTYAGITFRAVPAQPNLQVRSIRMDGNKVTTLTDSGGEDGVTCELLAINPANSLDIFGISLCNNILNVSGYPIQFTVANPLTVRDVEICHNVSSGVINTTDGGVSFTCSMFGAPLPTPSASAIASNIQISHNSIRNCRPIRAVYALFEIPVINLSVDHNLVHNAGTVAGATADTGNVQVRMLNQAGFPTYNAATNISVSHNKVSAKDETSVCYGGNAILVSANNTLTTEGRGISLIGNEINRHAHNGISVVLGYDAIRNLVISENLVSDVAEQAISVNGYDSTVLLEGVSVIDNTISNCNTAGVAGTSAIEILSTSGSAYSIRGNKITKAHRRGITVDGTGSTASLRNVEIGNNIVDYTSGSNPEESVYLYWPDPLTDVSVHGNNLIGSTTGVHVTGASVTALGSDEYITNVSVIDNNVSSTDYGIIVTNQNTGGVSGNYSKNVNISGNSVISTVTFAGIMFEQARGNVYNITMTNNRVDANGGKAILLDSGEADVYSATISGNQVSGVPEYYISVFSGTDASLNEVTVSGNNCRGEAISYGITVAYMSDFNNLTINNNKVNNASLQSILVSTIELSTKIAHVPSNLSITDNLVYNSGIYPINVYLSGSSSRAVKNISISRNSIHNWADYAAFTVYAIGLTIEGNSGNTIPVYGLTIDGNNLEDTVHDYVGGYSIATNEATKVVSFCNNKLILDNNSNSAAMDWQFTDNGSGSMPENFTFMGNIFRRTNGAVPTYGGIESNFATFYGNIGSAPNFWTNFALKFDNGGAGTVLPSVINSHNIDDGTV